MRRVVKTAFDAQSTHDACVNAPIGAGGIRGSARAHPTSRAMPPSCLADLK